MGGTVDNSWSVAKDQKVDMKDQANGKSASGAGAVKIRELERITLEEQSKDV